MVFYKSKLVREWLYHSVPTTVWVYSWGWKIIRWVYRNDILRSRISSMRSYKHSEIKTLQKKIDGMAIQIAKLTPEIDTLQNSD